MVRFGIYSDDRICLWIGYERLGKDPWVWGLSYLVIRVIQVIWRGFWKKGLEQGLKRRKDLGHKMVKKRVRVGKSQGIKEMGKEWENDPGVLSSSFLRARIVSTIPLEPSTAILHTEGIFRYSVNSCCLLRSDPKAAWGGIKSTQLCLRSPGNLLAERP